MNKFTEYLEEREILENEKMLNEDLTAVATSILGIGTVGLIAGFGGYLLLKGYTSLYSKFVRAIKKMSKMETGKEVSRTEVNKAMIDIKQNQVVKMAKERNEKEHDQYKEQLGEVYKAIEEKDYSKAKLELKNSGIKMSPVINRVIISEIVEITGEPPIHFGNTGNETYLLIKRILGIKEAQATAKVVKEALRKQSSELIKDVE